ncbi:protein LEO1 homolog [Triticum aestivum]|uniref:protein LEO1 homolog n=1 Tax=Triticum aestivum TaxID=4565 RepID=UPI001D015D00|nr:protein LEO1 homolog [Triticum aestivum]XP_044390514.1 protein LEO1 homolog [Triticum aestivum]XP_044390515.1 protein LEO1 homolog [Triticum aestivum]XP_044390516.1 protein LEO1 homolog [Triticum aestivum]
MHPIPPPQGPNQKRRFRLPRAQATRDRKHQKPEGIGEQSAQGRSLEEFRNEEMDKIFGDLSNSDEEVEDRANGGREVSGLNANNHAGGDNGHWNHSCRSLRLAHATTKHKYKSNSRRLHGNRWEDRKPGSHGPAGLAKQSVDEGHHVVLGYQNMRGNKEVMNGEKEGRHQRTETTRTRIVASEFEGSKYNCNVDQDRKDGEVKRTRKIGPTKDVLCDVGGSDVNGLALYGDTEDVNRLPTEGEGHCANILQPMDVTRDKDMCYEQESKHCLISPLLNLVVPHIPPSGQPDRLKVMKVSNVVGINPKPFDPETYMEEDDFVAPPARKVCIRMLSIAEWPRMLMALNLLKAMHVLSSGKMEPCNY